MLWAKKCIPFTFLLSILSILKPAYSESRIRKIELDEKDKGFFKAVTDMVIDGDKLIVADFFNNQVLCYSYIGGKAVFINLIGRPGQGPGDIQKPLALSALNNRIAIKDQEAISVFSLGGEYRSKFRQFSTFISFLLGRDRIYCLSSNPSSKYLIDVFDLDGQLVSQMIEKKQWGNSEKITTLDSFREYLIYDGQIWSDGKNLFYISKYFGVIEKYSLSGELIARKDLSKDLGNIARAKAMGNEKSLIQSSELKLVNGRPECHELFMDSYLSGGYLYLLMSQYDILNNKPTDEIDVRLINTDNLQISSAYTVKINRKERSSNICARTINGESIIVVDIASETGLDLYELYSEQRTSKH
jgi:hypothetical protein